MNKRPDQSLPLDQFLLAVNSSDQSQGWVVPNDDVRQRLSAEIERHTGAKASNLAATDVEKIEKWISAKPGQFIMETTL